MKAQLRKLFSPVLNPLEAGDDAFAYKSSHRKILIVMSALFSGLATIVFFLAKGQDPTYLLPVFLFGGAGLLGFIVGFLGEDKAVAKIWGSRELKK